MITINHKNSFRKKTKQVSAEVHSETESQGSQLLQTCFFSANSE